MRRLLGICGLFGIVLAALLLAPATTASALAPTACSGGSGYPVTPAASALVSTTTPIVGQTIEVSGSGLCPNEGVTIYIDAKVVGSAQTDANGAFDPPVTVPGPAGTKVLRIVGASGLPGDEASLNLTVRDAAGVAGVSTSSGGGGGGLLASTGAKIAGISVIAAALIVAGSLFVTAGRRRKAVVTG